MAAPTHDQDGHQIDFSISYDYNYVEPPPDRLMCKICQLPCREAQKSECCGHVFCKRDLEKMKVATAVSYACPICRIESFKTHPDPGVDREVKGLKVYCQNNEVGSGCNWTGEVNQIDEHLRKCEVACVCCKEVMHYSAMTNHINDCPCLCQYCDTVAERDVISDQHMQKCHKFPVPCPNACGRDQIPQDEVGSHKKECPLEVVWCEYYDIGRKTMLTRDKMPAHYRNEMAVHLQYMHNVIRQLKKGDDNLQSDDTEVVTEKSLHKNTELDKKEKLGVLTKFKIGTNEEHHKIEHNIMFILLSLLVLAFAVLISHYDGKFTLVTKNQSYQFERISKAIIETSANMEASEHYLIAVLHHLILDLSPSVISVDTKCNILSELSKTVSLVRPVFKFSGYKKMINNKGSWTSDPFFAFDKGYQMCLKVYPAGIGDASERHVSVEFYLMRGPHDEKLQQSGYWPLNGNFL